MRSVMQVPGVSLQWKQRHLTTPAFELLEGDEVFATLKFRNSFGTYAEGTTAEGSWSFKSQGFIKTHVTIREKGSENNIGVFHTNTWSEGGTLELPDGKKYQANSNFWHARYEFTDEAGNTIMQFTNIGGFKLHARLELFPPAKSLQETPWMILLGWYLAVMTSRDGEMVAAMF